MQHFHLELRLCLKIAKAKKQSMSYLQGSVPCKEAFEIAYEHVWRRENIRMDFSSLVPRQELEYLNQR